MHDLISYHIPEAVRIRIHAVDENGQVLLDNNGRPFTLNQLSVDPQITNFTVLESIIVKAFNLNGDYVLTYLNRSLNQYVQLKSDWELENAYLGNAKPYLDVKVDKTIVSNLSDDGWDIVTTSDLNRVASYAGKQTSQLANNFLNRMEKMVFKAFNKPQFEEELDENCNIANQSGQPNEQRRQPPDNQTSTFSKFNLLSKFKRRSTLSNEMNKQQQLNQQTNQQIIQQLTQTDQAKSITPNSSANHLLNTANSQADLNRTSSNVSTSSIRSSNYSLTRKDLSKKHTIQQKDLKARQPNLVKMKKISSVQDNQILQKILGKVNTSKTNLHEPLTEQQYLKYLHPDGRIKCLRELRLAIYRRGIEPSLRSTLYKHLLNVYPPNMTSEQRVRFVQQKSDQYYQLCFTWQRNFSHPKVKQVYNQVRKDVLRTDRSHPFYVSKCNLDTEQQQDCNDITSSVSTLSSILTQFDMKTNESSMNSNYTNEYSTSDVGIDNQVTSGVYENRNVQALTNILMTYALNHKFGNSEFFYWQGMSDLCSPLLLAIQNEADTYICFVALMRRLSANFNGDECMANKFDLLRKLVQHYDPEFFDYLEQKQASDLLFCYRWLLLELKREFKLDNALYMLEVSWAAMPPQFYLDLPMYNKKFIPTSDDDHQHQESKETVSIKSSPRPMNINQQNNNQQVSQSTELDAESLNSSKTLSNSQSFKSKNTQHHLNFSTKLKENNNNNIKNLKNEMTNAASDLGKQLSNGVNQIRKSVNEVASEFYANLNNQQSRNNEHKSVKSTVRSTLKGLKLSSVEEQLACKREKFHQQNTTGHSVNSLNDMRFSLDKDLGNQRRSKNSSLNGSNHSLIEYNNTLNYILNKTQAMLKQQEQKLSNFNFNFNLSGRKESTSCLSLFKDSSNKENQLLNRDTTTAKCTTTTTRQTNRHIRFLPNILSTDSNDNTIDSPDADDLNEKCGGNFPHLINKQFSIDSVDSMEFNFNNNNNNDSTLFKSNCSPSSNRQPFNNNFTCFSNFNSLPFTKQNSIPTQAALLKQQLKQSINQQQNHIFHMKQRSLPSSPLFKKKLDSFERPFLPFLQNVSNILDKHMFVAEPHTQKMSSVTVNTNTPSSSTYNRAAQISSKRSKLVSNQFDSFDQRDLFVHCNGENDMVNTSSKYNSNWKPERGLLNCFDYSNSSFDASTPFQSQQTQTMNNNNTFSTSTSNCSHQRLARQLSDKLINEKMHSSTTARQSSCEERDGKKQPLTHTQSATLSANLQNVVEFRTLAGQLTKLNLSNNSASQQQHQQQGCNNQYLKANSNHSNNSSTATAYEKEEKSEGYCSGSVSDRNSNYEDQCTNLENDLAFTNTFSNSTSSIKSSASSSSSSISSLSCSSSLVILSTNASFRSKVGLIERLTTLPSPRELSELSTGNAFMLFVCLTILLMHRDKLMNDNLDANDIAIYFDQHVRKHEVHLVVNIARDMFQHYLNKWQGYQLAEMLGDQSMLDSCMIDGQLQQ